MSDVIVYIVGSLGVSAIDPTAGSLTTANKFFLDASNI